MKRAQPTWLNKKLFPFESKWITIDGNTLHYVDEGSGPIILFAHGTPEWSFGYRKLINQLRKDFRCVAMDMLGFGLSDKPIDADYTCQSHAIRLERFIEGLQLQNISIVANDFGGGIAMSYVLNHQQNVRKIFLFNTWMWSLKNNVHYSRPAKMMNTWLGKILYLKFNFPVNVIMPAAFGNKRLLTKEVHNHYKNALPAGRRIAAYVFSQELMGASDWWEHLWNKVGQIDSKNFFFFWGLKDKFILSSDFEKWRTKLSNAGSRTFSDAGHFVQEEKSEEMIEAIRAFERIPESLMQNR